ncbi:MAG TPA: site-2 protease family protein, partial [Thermoanaerobaculia bacterium]|nr:site-2 protease family protein [Thermoanaerobaculia bacterium]
MKWSYTVARVSGIDIRIHATFALILALGAFQWGFPKGLDGESSFAGAVFGMGLMILLFACVVLHELGHSLVAQRFGLTVREIVLLPIGGVARLEKNPEKPLHELLIALAGPLVNVAIAILLFFAGGIALNFGLVEAQSLLTADGPPTLATLWGWLFLANVGLAVFNMIPAFPMDGGRVLRAALAMRLGFSRGTQIATVIGQAVAFAFGLFGVLSGNFLLVVVALFVFMGAGQERAEEQARTVLTTLRVGDAYNKHALVLSPGDHVSKVVDYILTSYQPDFAVVQGKTFLGVVTRDDVLKALATETNDLYVAGIMKREVLTVDARQGLDEVRRLMGEKGERIAAVNDDETFLGLVSVEDIGEALVVSSFVQLRDKRRA